MRSWRIPPLLRCFFGLPVLFALTMGTILTASTSSRADVEPKRVLMLHSFGLRFKPWTDHAQFIREEISGRISAQFHDHSLVSARLAGDKSEGPFVDYLQALYADKPPDLIVAIGAPAANFVQQYRHRLFPTTPMLFTVVQHVRVDYSKLTDNDTVVATHNGFPPLFENILRVLPETKTIAVVSGTSSNERFWQGLLREQIAPMLGKFDLKWYTEMSFEDILKDAANLPPHSAIFWQLLNVDGAGVMHEGGTALRRLFEVANAPIFSHDDAYFGEAIVGGPMQTKDEVAKTTADVAVRILNGEKAGDIKTPPLPLSQPKYDWRLMQRFGITESNLPPGSTVLFKPPSPWETYRWQILAVCTVLLLQGGLITLLMLERHRRQAAEMDSRQRMVELAHVNRFSTAGEMAASIAHEINQPLGAILNNTETAKMILESQSPNLKE